MGHMKRAAAALVALVLIVGACGGDEPLASEEEKLLVHPKTVDPQIDDLETVEVSFEKDREMLLDGDPKAKRSRIPEKDDTKDARWLLVRCFIVAKTFGVDPVLDLVARSTGVADDSRFL